MATYVQFHGANYMEGYGVIAGGSVVSETITESGSNQQSAAGSKPFVTVCSTVAVFVAIGENPNATTATARHYQPAGVPVTYGIAQGHKVAVVTA